MTITFLPSRYDEDVDDHVPLYRCRCDKDTGALCGVCTIARMNVASHHAFELLDWLKLIPRPVGAVRARALAVRCRVRLLPRPFDDDDDTPVMCGCRGRVIDAECPTDGLLRRTRQLLALADAAGGQFVSWA